MKVNSDSLLRAAIRIVEDMRIDNLFTMSEVERTAYSTAVAVMQDAINRLKEASQ